MLRTAFRKKVIVNQESSLRLLGKENDVVGAQYTHSPVAGSGDGTEKAVAGGTGVGVNFQRSLICFLQKLHA